MTPGMHDRLHPQRTRRSNYEYMFTSKHHGGGSSDDARWLPGLPDADEFKVFDDGDFHQILDRGRNVFGALKEGEDSLRVLGTCGQQVAKFWAEAATKPWHGFPAWPLNEEAAENRKAEKARPDKDVFDRMLVVGLIDASMRKRLMKGDHA